MTAYSTKFWSLRKFWHLIINIFKMFEKHCFSVLFRVSTILWLGEFFWLPCSVILSYYYFFGAHRSLDTGSQVWLFPLFSLFIIWKSIKIFPHIINKSIWHSIPAFLAFSIFIKSKSCLIIWWIQSCHECMAPSTYASWPWNDLQPTTNMVQIALLVSAIDHCWSSHCQSLFQISAS